MTRKVGLVGTQFDAEICDLLPANKGRSSLVYKMISSYKLNEKCDEISIKRAKKSDLLKFHDEKYVDLVLKKRKEIDMNAPLHLKEKLNISSKGEGEEQDGEEDDEADDEIDEETESGELLFKYGLLYDSHIFPLMSEYVQIVAGSSISAAKYLMNSNSPDPICINWNGGRHHAKKSKASGFCYINDIVLGILELRKKFNKIIYIDFDLHHGDGVETAFKFSDKVISFSIHRKDLGFFPGTGSIDDVGKGKGLNSTFNIPIRHGLNDESIDKIVNDILMPIINKLEPDCLCIQCGCDGLNSDEHKEWNLTIKGIGKQIEKLLNLNKPTLLFGGGGYNHQQVARCWTYLTSIALKDNTNFDILPDDLIDELNNEYEFWDIKPMNMIDENDNSYIKEMTQVILNRLKQ